MLSLAWGLRLDPIVGSNTPKPNPIYASLRLAFHPKCALSARKCITQYRVKVQIIHCQFFFWIRPWVDIAKSLSSGSNVVLSRYCYHVTHCALYRLKNEAFEQYFRNEDVVKQTYAEWCTMMEGKFTQFVFWSITMRMIWDLLIFVRAIRRGHFEFYKYAIEKLLPWLFIHDHFNFARWLSVHLHDLQTVDESCPSVYEEFLNGNFVVSRTSTYFSAMCLDQRHEQHNKDVGVKGEL